MDTRSSHGSSSHVSAEYDAFGQVIITEAGGRYSLRSRASSDDVRRSVLPADDARSHGSADRPALTNGHASSPVFGDRPTTSPASPQYRRRGMSVDDDATVASGGGGGGGTVSSASSSLLRRIGRRRKRDDDVESESTTRCSDFSRAQSKRAGGGQRWKNRRKKKHGNGRSIDKHGDPAGAARRYSAPESDAAGPDNEYWRTLVAEQHRRTSLDDAERRRRRGSSPQRRSVGNEERRRSSQVNGTSSLPTVETGSAGLLDANGNLRQSGRKRHGSSASQTGGDCRGCSVMIPALMFLVVGCLLVVVGVVRVFVSFWHEFGSSIWSGALLMLFGSIHAVLARQYDRRVKTLLYIVVGVATSVAVLIACAFSLLVLVPTLSQVTAGVDDSLDSRVRNAVNFSKYATNETVTGVSSIAWPSVVLDSFSLLLLTVALYSQTATVVAVDRYWESYCRVTGKCRHCGPPRLCNPFEQMSLGQAAIVVGLVEITMLEYIPDHDSTSPHAWSMLWSGALLIFAGFSGSYYGKRTDSTVAGVVSVVLMSCSLLACAVTVVLTTLSTVKDADRLRIAVQHDQSAQYSLSNVIALVVVQGIVIFIAAVGLLFVAGNLYRQLRRLLCYSTAAVEDTRHLSISSPSYHRPQVVAPASL